MISTTLYSICIYTFDAEVYFSKCGQVFTRIGLNCKDCQKDSAICVYESSEAYEKQ